MTVEIEYIDDIILLDYNSQTNILSYKIVKEGIIKNETIYNVCDLRTVSTIKVNISVRGPNTIISDPDKPISIQIQTHNISILKWVKVEKVPKRITKKYITILNNT